MKRYLVALIYVLFFNGYLYAIQCIEGDFDEMLCSLPVLPGTRCQDAKWFRIYCNKSTDGCRGVNGGCIGMTPPGHWYPLVEGGYPRWRCRCGCFGEETTFLTSSGKINGKYLYDNFIKKENKITRIKSLDNLNHITISNREFNSLMFSSQDEGISIMTEKGREIILSHSHPVVVSSEEGSIQLMKRAQDIEKGDYLLDFEGITDRVQSKNVVSYGKNMINFNIKSMNGANHIISANELLMGDLGWQETLNSFGSRILYRTEILKFIEKI